VYICDIGVIEWFRIYGTIAKRVQQRKMNTKQHDDPVLTTKKDESKSRTLHFSVEKLTLTDNSPKVYSLLHSLVSHSLNLETKSAMFSTLPTLYLSQSNTQPWHPFMIQRSNLLPLLINSESHVINEKDLFQKTPKLLPKWSELCLWNSTLLTTEKYGEYARETD
jgi:hypothetical protein